MEVSITSPTSPPYVAKQLTVLFHTQPLFSFLVYGNVRSTNDILRILVKAQPGTRSRGVRHGVPRSTRFRNPLDFTRISDFRMDFWISKWISGFQSGFLDFKVDFRISKWISGFPSGFLDFQVDFWISK